MLLRRTRADQVAGILSEALHRFPTPEALARARRGTARRVFGSAGLATRADQLRNAAQVIVREHGGKVPTNIPALQELPGVGPYVASMVAAVTVGAPVVLVDTNSVRVATRVLGIVPATKEPRRESKVIAGIEGLLGGPQRASLWFAVIDLAHRICRPADPDCGSCPLAPGCAAAVSGRTQLACDTVARQ